MARLVADVGPAAAELVARLDELRNQYDGDLPLLTALDSAPSFRPALHLPGRNASPLIFACTLVDALRERPGTEPVLVCGNSLGFYTALVVSGALDVEAGYRLIATMARLQDLPDGGGQVLWTLIDEDWNLIPERRAALARALAKVAARGPDHAVAISIRLGGHVVLAGTEKGTQALLAELPKVRLGKREFPFRLAFHGPFHTPLLAPVAAAARVELADLDVRRPKLPLIDGRGHVWSPLSTDPQELLDYTLGAQVTATFDFTSMLQCALGEFAPDDVVLLGPGSSLRAPVGHIQRWSGWSASAAATA